MRDFKQEFMMELRADIDALSPIHHFTYYADRQSFNIQFPCGFVDPWFLHQCLEWSMTKPVYSVSQTSHGLILHVSNKIVNVNYDNKNVF